MLVVAGFDVSRYHRSGSVAPWLQIAALVLVFSGIFVHGVGHGGNRFFSSAVRLQTDRGQVVVDSGPCRFVRHPATRELSRILPAASRGSWLATLIAGVPMILLCRALLDDKMLREELAGYKEYAAQVNRLALGIW
jgi:protein-S-isoprenylcysteine O-methyltransferase Ste14